MLELATPKTGLGAVMLILLAGCLAGCGGSESAVDPAPFESAIAKYLEANNMALKVKEIKEGPTVEGTTAHVVASLTHVELGGASVTWKFAFEKSADGTWKATGHEK